MSIVLDGTTGITTPDINFSGSLGIGTSLPNGKLDIESSTSNHLFLTRTGVGAYTFGVGASNVLQIGNDGTERARIDSSGLSVAGTVESTSGGFKFPDGTVQTTAGGAGVGAVAFARISQSTVLSSHNISSVAVGGANAVVTFATALQDANYAPLVSPSLNSTGQFGNSGSTASTHAITSNNFQIYGRGYTGSNNTSYGYGGVFNAMAIAVFR